MPFMVNILLFYNILYTFSPDLCNSKLPDTSEVFKQQQHSKLVNKDCLTIATSCSIHYNNNKRPITRYNLQYSVGSKTNCKYISLRYHSAIFHSSIKYKHYHKKYPTALNAQVHVPFASSAVDSLCYFHTPACGHFESLVL